jgi:hypothetical protein
MRSVKQVYYGDSVPKFIKNEDRNEYLESQ